MTRFYCYIEDKKYIDIKSIGNQFLRLKIGNQEVTLEENQAKELVKQLYILTKKAKS